MWDIIAIIMKIVVAIFFEYSGNFVENNQIRNISQLNVLSDEVVSAASIKLYHLNLLRAWDANGLEDSST